MLAQEHFVSDTWGMLPQPVVSLLTEIAAALMPVSSALTSVLETTILTAATLGVDCTSTLQCHPKGSRRQYFNPTTSLDDPTDLADVLSQGEEGHLLKHTQ